MIGGGIRKNAVCLCILFTVPLRSWLHKASWSKVLSYLRLKAVFTFLLLVARCRYGYAFFDYHHWLHRYYQMARTTTWPTQVLLETPIWFLLPFQSGSEWDCEQLRKCSQYSAGDLSIVWSLCLMNWRKCLSDRRNKICKGPIGNLCLLWPGLQLGLSLIGEDVFKGSLLPMR